ncbi:MAG: hypothetical protein OXG79_12280 [Chloroflexi bacterium]|nr:hypothetical protein [Chloroflexota bacterium]
MFDLTVKDGYTPCHGCAGYIETDKEDFVAFVIPYDPEKHQWRGKATFHPRCWVERDPAEPLLLVTGVRSGLEGR